MKYSLKHRLYEVYELDDEQKYRRDQLHRSSWNGPEMAHLAGLDTSEEQRRDRKGLQFYQDNIQSRSGGRKLIRAFRNGEVLVLHDMAYEGAAARSGMGGSKDMKMLPSQWIEKYGMTGGDTLSTVAYYSSADSDLPGYQLWGNGQFVFQSRGLIMKGYPVYVGKSDTMTQTLGALDDKIKSHWTNSGIPKRPAASRVSWGDNGELGSGIETLRMLRKNLLSPEALLDNWTVTGTFINSSHHPDSQVQAWIEDSLSIGLPCNVYNGDGNLTRHEP
jgi:hypothetical protein